MGEAKRLIETTESSFKPGQVWSYRTRPGEEASRLTVVKVNRAPKIGVVVSVYVEGLKVKNPGNPKGFNGEILHMPFSEKALKESVIQLAGTVSELPGYEKRYGEWKEGFENGDAGVFGLSVSEAIGHIEETVNSQ